jgi:thiol-disulfide isomerase/thioredoxin
MKSILSIFTAAAFSLAANVTAFASPEEWVGKELPALGVTFLGTPPELKGKAAIVEFWATWCPPCRASIPHLNEINKKFKDKGLVVIGISDEPKETVEKFRKGLPMEYNVAVGGAAIEKKFGINGIPHAFIVGKDGKIVWHGHPMQLKDADIEKVLK